MAVADKDDLISILEEDKPSDIPASLPLMPVRDVVIFTDMLLPLFVGREKSVRAIEKAVARDGYLFLATQKDQTSENPKSSDIYEVGTICRALRMLKLPDGRVKALVQGVAKARVVRYIQKRRMFYVAAEIIEDKELEKTSMEVEALMRNIREYSEKILSLRGEFTGDVSNILKSITDPGKLADLVASNLRLKVEESQMVLEITDPVKRLRKVNDMLTKEVELSSIQAKIQSDVKDEISKNQRDHFLREQVRAIYRELGEKDDRAVEIEDYEKKIKRAKMPAEAQKEAHKELKRLEQMHPDSAESGVVRTYLDWLTAMPWSKSTRDVMDIPRAKDILDMEHHGLEKIKDLILEYLSARKLNPKMKGPILCFVGPPGVGKTSLGKAVAQAMKRKFTRISLGGIRDEAEIRGHRRTYIGAMPGRILQGLKQCKTRNPVFMMDEIDKIGADFRGDPSSALLEALDPEQNAEFSDHYLNLHFDLSRVMFIMTANRVDTIPSALLDRMEVIELSGYDYDEKRIIARKHLLPRRIKENGLKWNQISISPGALGLIISQYTSEAGLRNLERELGAVCRKVARKIAEGLRGRFHVTAANLKKYLGPPRYIPEMDQEKSAVGLSTGLAWTQAGGETLYIEAAFLSGKGELTVTGQIGEVMQESAKAAVTYARSSLKALGRKENFFENLDVHIHVPAGAIPKDGPSAGIAMAVAIISAIVEKPVDQYIAMTGEITIRGRALPIGGLKEKALGAIRGGIRAIIIPEKNKKDLEEMPASVKKKIKFFPVKHVDEALRLALKESE
ncbi:Lon protease [Candidatus Desulfarcum epimagneticum]|uniref:Lon protease n=1 Tax=uncultured Desulfobacteraceae bacterium TaxID=218296 RepID=A0A484HMA4_9BACT|nr:Lon protease [uncultured Desulfobacteraceae bacterium]